MRNVMLTEQMEKEEREEKENKAGDKNERKKLSEWIDHEEMSAVVGYPIIRLLSPRSQES